MLPARYDDDDDMRQEQKENEDSSALKTLQMLEYKKTQRKTNYSSQYLCNTI